MSRTNTKIIIAQKDGTVVGQYYLGQGEHLIGREGDCTIQLEADHVSRQHARLIINADAIEIEDLGSTSGTYLDGITVKGRITIQPGQKLWISDLYIDIERQGFGGLIKGSRLGDGRFTLKRELGKGGMGAVWLALDEEVQENVALKLVSGEISMDPKCLKDLQREVNKSHNLVHPNIVRMGYFWKEEGEPAFISLEYVDGTDLNQLRSESPHGLLAWKDVQSYMIQLCDALEYAHTQKVAHRDIKPGNFMINSEGNLKLTDFGIAATLTSTSMSFTSSSVLGSGTPPYMSPQQLDAKRPHVTDDIYSVGATFYELLTSKPPFHQGDIAYQVRHTEAAPMGKRLRELGWPNEIPEYVSAIVMACLQKDPTQRPQSMHVIREWIESAEEGVKESQTTKKDDLSEDLPESWLAPAKPASQTVVADPPPEVVAKKPSIRGSRKKWAYGIGAAVVLAVIFIMAGSLFGIVGEAVVKISTVVILIKMRAIRKWISAREDSVGVKEEVRVAAQQTQTQGVTPSSATTKEASAGGGKKKWAFGIGAAVVLVVISIIAAFLSDPSIMVDPIVEKDIRISLNKPTGKLTKSDLEKIENADFSDGQLTYAPKGLEKLTKLTSLNLQDNQLTDVKCLEKLKQLRWLFLRDNPDLTKAQIAELQKALPKCIIFSNAKK